MEADSVKLIGIKSCVREFIDFFVLFRVLAIDKIIMRLQISLVPASQALKVLRSVGAVNFIYIPGALRDKYSLESKITKILMAAVQEELKPWLDQALERIRTIQSIANAMACGMWQE